MQVVLAGFAVSSCVRPLEFDSGPSVACSLTEYGPATAPEPLSLVGFAHAPVRQVLAVAARPASEGRAGPGPLAASALLDVLTFVPGSRPCIPTAASTSPPLLDDVLAFVHPVHPAGSFDLSAAARRHAGVVTRCGSLVDIQLPPALVAVPVWHVVSNSTFGAVSSFHLLDRAPILPDPKWSEHSLDLSERGVSLAMADGCLALLVVRDTFLVPHLPRGEALGIGPCPGARNRGGVRVFPSPGSAGENLHGLAATVWKNLEHFFPRILVTICQNLSMPQPGRLDGQSFGVAQCSRLCLWSGSRCADVQSQWPSVSTR